MKEEDHKQALRLWAQFAALAPSHRAVESLAAASQRRRLAAADVLVSEAEEDGTVFLVATGTLRTVRYTASGHEVWYADVKVGDVVGDMAALIGGRRTSSVVAKTACTLLAIEPATFLEVARQHADFAIAIARMLAHRLQVTSAHLAGLATLSVSSRVHGELISLGTPAPGDAEAYELATPPKVQALSDRIHATREATSRALSDLEARGLLTRRRSKWTIILPNGEL